MSRVGKGTRECSARKVRGDIGENKRKCRNELRDVWVEWKKETVLKKEECNE